MLTVLTMSVANSSNSKINSSNAEKMVGEIIHNTNMRTAK